MRFSSVSLISAGALLLGAASPPVVLRPSGPWVVDYADNSCLLERTFGTGDQETKLTIESGMPGSFDLLIMGKPLSSRSPEIAGRFAPGQSRAMFGRPVVSSSKHPGVLWTKVQFLPDDALAKWEQFWEEVRKRPKERPPAISLADRAETRAQRAKFTATITSIEVEPRQSPPVVLATGSLGQAIQTLEKCSLDSLADWGVDANIEDQIVRPAWPTKPGLGLTANSYPNGMLRRGEESKVTVRVLVDADGRVTKCTAFSRFKYPQFSELVCAVVIKRARFEPAELANGTKVPSYYSNIVSFELQ